MENKDVGRKETVWLARLERVKGRVLATTWLQLVLPPNVFLHRKS